MIVRALKIFNRRFVFLTLLTVCVPALLPSCGRVTQGVSEALELRLELPEGESADLFWYGVAERRLRRVDEEGGAGEWLEWSPGQSRSLDLRAGDRIEFEGRDREGRLLVVGAARVGEEKKISVPLRRVL